MKSTPEMKSLNDKELLSEFRSKFKGTYLFQLEDHVLWSILLACKGDQDKAKDLCIRFMEAQFILTNSRRICHKNYIPSEEVVRNLNLKFLGNDEFGRFVVWCASGDWNPRELVKKGLKNELFMFIFKILEECCLQLYNQSKESSGQQDTHILIADVKNLTLKNFFHYDVIRYLLSYSKDIKPLTTLVHKVYIINSSWVFYYILNMLKLFLTTKALNKIVILDLDENKWKEFLRKNFSEELLPNEYGGIGGKAFA